MVIGEPEPLTEQDTASAGGAFTWAEQLAGVVLPRLSFTVTAEYVKVSPAGGKTPIVSTLLKGRPLPIWKRYGGIPPVPWADTVAPWPKVKVAGVIEHEPASPCACVTCTEH